jgi:hypothetical protein
MEKFTKSILNYFATYTETRFRFQTKIRYKWTDDIFTAELSVFPEFQKKVLDSIKNKSVLNISVKQGEYSVSLSEDDFKKALLKKLDTNYNLEFLENCIEQARAQLRKAESDKTIIAGGNKDARDNTEVIVNKEFEEKALREGLRKFNLAFRSAIQEILLKLQKQKKDELLQELHFTSAPITSLNPNSIEQEIYNSLRVAAGKADDEKSFLNQAREIIKTGSFELRMYDLYATIRKFSSFIGMGRPYIFFHQISLEGDSQNAAPDKYPIFLVELNIEEKSEEVVLSCDRNVLLINTPAINSFEFNNILTIPRAARLNEASNYLWGVEKFLQNNYDFFNPFLLEYAFKPLSADNRPTIKYRLGLQVVQKEDRRLFDYSELITRIDAGKGGKLIDFVEDYVSGNVKNTADEVDSAYNKRYPKKSVNNLLSTIPLSLNKSQRRILTALDNPKNKTIVVDGPPGTGKSYTIAAITYWANQQNKSVVITSHKKAALDIIDRMLIDKFRELHPKAKPSVLRITEDEKGINTSQNTLSSPVITAANNRTNDFNEDAVKKDIENWRAAVETQLNSYWDNSFKYKELTDKLFKLERLENELKQANIYKDGILIPKMEKNTFIDIDLVKECINSIYKSQIDALSTTQLFLLYEKRDLLPSLLETCNFVNRSSIAISDIMGLNAIDRETLEDFLEAVSKIGAYLKGGSLVFTDVKKLKVKLSAKLSMMLRRKEGKDELRSALSKLSDLQYENILSNISRLSSKDKSKLTLKDLESGAKKNIEIEAKRQDIELLLALKKDLGLQGEDIKRFYNFLSNLKDILRHIKRETITSLKAVREYFSPLMNAVGINLDNLKTAGSLLSKERAEKLFEYIQLFSDLAKNELCDTPDMSLITSYYESIHKHLEYINDKRLKNLNNYTGDVERILVSLRSRKRLKVHELKVILENISCIISEPDLISQYFPMEEDIIDILVIDEASQVSIAESISLILRAKQVVIFGDELQYGAVSAVNVNAQYAGQYFKEILDSYQDDYRVTLSEKEKQEISQAVSQEIDPEEQEIEPVFYKPEEGTVDWLKTFSIRTSTLNFAKAIKNYSVSLDTHFRSFPEIIDYSNEFFYKQVQVPLIINRIRTKPISEVLRFLKVETQGNSGTNVNLDEIEAMKKDIQSLVSAGFKGTIGIITSFREQRDRAEEVLRKEILDYHSLKKTHKLTIWFVGDVQGEERDIVYYSFVEDKKIGNGSLRNIYPIIGGSADNIRKLKMQRLNVGFSRAKDTMVFVHSMPINEYSDTRLGDALKRYKWLLETAKDNFIEDESIFGSPAEKDLYIQITNTDFYKKNRDKIKIIAQFPMGKYIEETLKRYVPKYRVDFLLTLSERGKEKSLILEYDGLEYHTKNPEIVTAHNFSQEYLDYDIARQLELESYGYKFLRINKFTLIPKEKGQTKIDVLDGLLKKKFAS